MFKKINLKNEDKYDIRRNLLSFMEENPVRENRLARYLNWKSMLPGLKLNLQFMPIKIITAVLAVAVILGGSATAFAAEGSLPGDALYSVQSATEQVRGWMKFSSASKAEWHAKMTEKRLGELDNLLSEGKITEEQKTKLEEKIQNRVEMASQQFEKMKERGEAGRVLGIAAKLENSLKTREHIFKNAGKMFEKLAEKDAKFAEKLKDKASFIALKREDIEEKIKNDNSEKMKSAAKGKMTAAENKIEEVKKFIEKNKEKFGEEAALKAREKLVYAKAVVADGKNKMDEKKYGEAFVLFQKAHWLAQEAKMLAMGKNNPGILMNAGASASSTATSTINFGPLRGKGIGLKAFKK